MNKKVKKNIKEFTIIGGVFLTLYLTGLHTEVFGFLQRGVLATGVLTPDIEEDKELLSASANPKADFSLKLVNSKGEKVNMEQFKGKVIFLNLWATWCPPCVAEMPGINSLYNKVKNEDVVFLMVSLDEDFEKAKRFNAKKGFNFEVYKPDGGLPRMYYSRSIPTTYIISSKGELVLTQTGMAEYDTPEFIDFLKKQK